MPIIQIEMFKGRSIEQKKAIVKEVTEAMVHTAGCKPESVEIIIREKYNFSSAGRLKSDEQGIS